MAEHSAYAQITRGIAHEIKNPFALLLASSELLLENISDKDFVENYAHQMINTINRLNKLLHIMLDYSKPTVSTYESQQFSVNKSIDDLIQLANFKAQSNKITLSF